MNLRALWVRLGEDDVLILASSTAYAAVLSVFPLLLGAIALLSFLVAQPQAQEAVLRALAPYVPDETLGLVRDTILAVTATRGAAGLIGITGLLWGATAIAGSLRQALNRVLGATVRSFWRQKLVDFGFVLLAGLFLGFSVLGGAVLGALRLRPVAELTSTVGGTAVAAAASWVVSIGFSLLAFFITYRFLPNRRLHRRAVLWGTLAGAALFEALKRAFFWYLRTLANYPLVYGPIAGLVVFMVWVYLVAAVVLIGAEIIRSVEDASGGAHG